MGLFSIPKEILIPVMWNNLTMKMRPEAKKQILAGIPGIVPAKDIKEVFLLGSTAGYKYDDDSDVDVDVIVPMADITDEAQVRRKAANGKLLLNSQHPINYFLQPYEMGIDWKDSYFGVYDILNDVWASPPIKPSAIRDPKKEFYFDLKFAKLKLNAFRELVKRWKEYANKKYPTKHDILLAHKFFSDARSYAQRLDEERKLDYRWSWGTPRKNWRNVVYKLIEHSDVGKEFEYLKELK